MWFNSFALRLPHCKKLLFFSIVDQNILRLQQQVKVLSPLYFLTSEKNPEHNLGIFGTGVTLKIPP